MTYDFRVGTPRAISSLAPAGAFSVVFEDDGATGYVYGVRRRRWRSPDVLDALHL